MAGIRQGLLKVDEWPRRRETARGLAHNPATDSSHKEGTGVPQCGPVPIDDYFRRAPTRREVQMRVTAMIFSAPLLTAGVIALGATLLPVTGASAATVVVRP